MLLAVDIGNSSIKFGVFDQDRLTGKFSIPTRRDHTPGEIAEQVGGRVPVGIDRSIMCSVVPELDEVFADYLSQFAHIEPRFVTAQDDFGLTINFPITTTGADRLINSFAAVRKYGIPVIVVSFGTATTIDVVDAKRAYLGGIIAPGMTVLAKALAIAASKLPEVEIVVPEHVIATTTETAIQSGIFYGHIAMIEGLIKRIVSRFDERPTVVATGGFAELIAAHTAAIDIVDNDLTLTGLQMLWRSNSD